MYLHAGQKKIIREKNIIGIFDMDNRQMSETTKKYLREAERDGLCELATEDLPKSFIVYSDRESDFADRGKYKFCLSQLSTAALAGRIKKGIEET